MNNVTLLDNMGNDLAVVNAARVSLGKESKEFNKQDERLIKYLAKHNHWTPFSQSQIKFRIRMPIFIARQWFRSNMGLTRNEVSRRYVDNDPGFYIPEIWRLRPEGSIKQGSGNELDSLQQKRMEHMYKAYLQDSIRVYEIMLATDVAPEQARMVLPQSMYTEFIETGSLAAYARVFKLRNEQHAQKEIQEYALEIDKILCKLYPVSWHELTK